MSRTSMSSKYPPQIWFKTPGCEHDPRSLPHRADGGTRDSRAGRLSVFVRSGRLRNPVETGRQRAEEAESRAAARRTKMSEVPATICTALLSSPLMSPAMACTPVEHSAESGREREGGEAGGEGWPTRRMLSEDDCSDGGPLGRESGLVALLWVFCERHCLSAVRAVAGPTSWLWGSERI